MINGEKICDAWRKNDPLINPKGYDRCYGTKEREACTCGGDESKCDFYPKKRKVGKGTKVDVMAVREAVKRGEITVHLLDDVVLLRDEKSGEAASLGRGKRRGKDTKVEEEHD